MKYYGEASCSGASAEPVKDTDMSEREENSLISVCNNVIWNFAGFGFCQFVSIVFS